MRALIRAGVISLAMLMWSPSTFGEPVSVRIVEGVLREALALRAANGDTLAHGELTQQVHGDVVTTRVVFRFHDGSVHDETAVFSQHDRFRLLTDRLEQRGPAFPHALTMTIDAARGTVDVHTTARDGATKQYDEHMDLPSDLANGILPTLVKNLGQTAPPTSFAFVVATPRPRLVRLAVSRVGREPFNVAGTVANAVHYLVKVEIGGISGVLAPLVGQKPPDSHVWVATGDSPAFVGSEQPLFVGGPPWRIELVSPESPR